MANTPNITRNELAHALGISKRDLAQLTAEHLDEGADYLDGNPVRYTPEGEKKLRGIVGAPKAPATASIAPGAALLATALGKIEFPEKNEGGEAKTGGAFNGGDLPAPDSPPSPDSDDLQKNGGGAPGLAAYAGDRPGDGRCGPPGGPCPRCGRLLECYDRTVNSDLTVFCPNCTPVWGTLTVVRPMGNARFVLCTAEDGKTVVELRVRDNKLFCRGMKVEPRRYRQDTVREGLAALVGRDPRFKGHW